MKKLISIPSKSPWEIKPDTLLFSDLHLHEREEFGRVNPQTGLNSRFSEGLSILDQIIEINKNHKEIRYNINLGDIFELKDRIPNHILIEYKNRAEQIPSYITILGNHDYNLLNYPTLKIFTSKYLDEPLISHIGLSSPHDKWGFIPFQRKQEDFVKALIEMNKSNLNIIFFHQELPGGEYESGKKIPGILPFSWFRPDIKYISGHLHKHQTVGKVMYLGSPYQIKFSDEGSKKFVWLMNSKTLEMTSLELKYPKFISFDNNEAFDLDQVSGNYIRVTGETESQNWTPEIKKTIKETLEKAGALGVTFQVKIIRPHLVKIAESDVENDELIIQSYTKENFKHLNEKKLLEIGLEIFYQN